MRLTTLLRALPLATLVGERTPAPMPRYTHVYVLKPKEGVFAYARISPDGRQLVYASETTDPRRPNGISENVTIVDLATQRIRYSAPGIDAYWSVDGTRMIFSSYVGGVAIRHTESGAVTSNVAPPGLGDYYSWAVRDGKNLIVTITGNYYYLDGDKAVVPHAKVTACDKIGSVGDRPLVSKDGMRISTFVNGNVVVRGLDNCDDILDTGIQGAKADFSWDGRYIAFHTLKAHGTGYEIKIVDLKEYTVRTLPGLAGSALFPSWTRDGRLCFRYDGLDYRGFVMASGVLDVAAEPLPSHAEHLPARREWNDIFPETSRSQHRVHLVMIWAPWSAHTREAFDTLAQARDYFAREGADLAIGAAPDPGSTESDIARALAEYHVTIPRLPISARGLVMTEARNQMPTTLLFRDGVLIDRRLGAQGFEELRAWVGAVLGRA
jgi:hypothetical protein